MKDAELDALIQSAQDALARASLTEGLATAEQAWLASQPEDGPRRLRAGQVLMQLRYRTGKFEAMLDLAPEVLHMLRVSGPTSGLIDTLRMVAVCAADTHRFDQSLSSAQEALQLSLDLDDRARISLSTNALACFFERSGDPWQAERLLLDALAQARLQSQGHPLFTALNNLGAALIGKFFILRDGLPVDDAREPLRKALPYVEESVQMARAGADVLPKVFCLGNLAEVHVHLGQTAEAEPRLQEALSLAQAHGFEAQVWRMRCTQGELLLARGQTREALDALLDVLELSARADQPITRMRLHHAAWRAAAALGLDGVALHHLQKYLELERLRSVRQLRAQSDLFVTRMEAEQARLEAQRQHARARALEADVRRDQLTGLGNRREAEARWPELLKSARAEQSPLSVAMLDLDHFKQVNDRHGHAVGDQVLVALATLLQAHTRASDLAARLGGEEFLLVLRDTDAPRAAEVCERLRSCVQAHDWEAIAPDLKVTVSIGLTSAPPYDAQTLSLRADAALYRAKGAGRNCLVQA
jgi:diguanylate cyclase (GGDEF)-like protein